MNKFYVKLLMVEQTCLAMRSLRRVALAIPCLDLSCLWIIFMASCILSSLWSSTAVRSKPALRNISSTSKDLCWNQLSFEMNVFNSIVPLSNDWTLVCINTFSPRSNFVYLCYGPTHNFDDNCFFFCQIIVYM